MDKAFYKKPHYLALWVHLLLSANHEETEFMWNGGIIKVKKGQFITGRKQLSAQSGIAESTVEDILKFLETQQQIRQQKTTKYRLITILNWNKHQESNNKATTKQQQADTNKNDKKEKNLLGEQSSHLKGKDMSWNKQPDDEAEVFIDADSGEEIKPAQKVKRNYKPVYSLFEEILGKKPNNWLVNTTQQKCAENLFTERGIPAIKNALQWYKDHKEEEFCPQISSPSDLDAKWTKLGEFKKKHGN